MWPKRMLLSAFIREGYVEGSAPHVETLRKRIKENKIPGEVQGSVFYVFVGPHNELMAPGQSDADVLADSLMAEYEAEYGTDQAA